MQTPTRIVMIGTTGSGKTTLARQVSAALGIDFTDLDDLYWLPDWTPRADEDFRRLAADAAAADNWVIAGNYSKTRDIVWIRATDIVWLDYSFHLVFRRLLRRTVSRLFDHREICNGNREDWRHVFSGKSILIWLFRTYWKKRREYGALFSDAGLYPQARYIRLRNPAAAENWLAALSTRKTS